MDSNRIINGAINGAISAVLATVFIGLLTAAANLLSNGKMAEALGAVSDREMKQVISDFDKKIAPKLEACRVCFREVAKSPNQCKPQYPEAETCSGWSTSSAKGPWTQIFLDDTDDGAGGCKYQWRLECRAN
ncbi:hypothetical protein [Ruegeria sp.]|uniref:hypothetical protein n=1 Tax=Ruegeria sp. TaxID=1879320 RepID=UPI003AFFDB49